MDNLDAKATQDAIDGIPDDLLLQPVSRRPTTLADRTLAVAKKLLPPVGIAACQRVRSSIIIVTFNGEPFTRLCIASLIANTPTGGYEIIVIDNGSADGTPNYLRTIAANHQHIRVIPNTANRGFAAANNQGLAAARGEVLVLLNNDTMVPPHWLGRLEAHLADPAVGLVGPTTNRAPNEAKIETAYNTHGEFLAFAERQYQAFGGESFDIPMLIMFAVAMRREVYQAVGGLDENFGIGMFEDDDYALRVRQQGYRILCARDCFVHHFGQASLGTLTHDGEFQRIFDRNQAYFEKKWNRAWQPHKPGDAERYERLVAAICVAGNLLITDNDPRSIISVISYGDERLIRALSRDGRVAWHFPRQDDGTPLGHHPANDDEAIAMLHRERTAGAGWLIIPEPSFWWLKHYLKFGEHLHRQCRRLDAPDGCCAIFDLASQ
jgi:GT2 family glycosyltransferase